MEVLNKEIWDNYGLIQQRGLLGEIAVQRFFIERLGTQIEQDTSLDLDIDDYISTDIKRVQEPSGEYRATKINTSIKTGKFNARW